MMHGQLTSPSEVRVSTCMPAGIRTYRLAARTAPVPNFRSFPAQPNASASIADFVPVYRCGAVPVLHRIPFFDALRVSGGVPTAFVTIT